jgi:hypothetical protein
MSILKKGQWGIWAFEVMVLGYKMGFNCLIKKGLLRSMNGSFPLASTICSRIYFGNLRGDQLADFRRCAPSMQEEHTSTDGMGVFCPSRAYRTASRDIF